jgi:hypothetical protein
MVKLWKLAYDNKRFYSRFKLIVKISDPKYTRLSKPSHLTGLNCENPI